MISMSRNDNQNNLLRLGTRPYSDGTIDILINATKYNYIILSGNNNPDAIDCLHAFLNKNGVWGDNDTVHIVPQKQGIRINPKYADISFVLRFYNMALLAKEAREERMANMEAQRNHNNYHCDYYHPPHDNSSTDRIERSSEARFKPKEPAPKLNIKHLANENINHSKSMKASEKKQLSPQIPEKKKQPSPKKKNINEDSSSDESDIYNTDELDEAMVNVCENENIDIDSDESSSSESEDKSELESDESDN